MPGNMPVPNTQEIEADKEAVQDQLYPTKPLDPNAGLGYHNLADYTIVDSAAASFRLGAQQTATKALWDIHKLNELQLSKSPMLTPDQLADRYPGMGRWEQPYTEAAAEEIARRKEERNKLEYAVARGPSDTFYGAGLNFAASAVAHALDPLELGAGMLAGGAFNAMGASLVEGAAGRALFTKTATGAIEQRLAGQIVSGTVGNLLTEPLVIAAEGQNQNPYTIYDAFTGAVGGAIGGVAIGLAHRGVMNMLSRLGPKHADLVLSSVVGQMEGNKKVDVDHVINDMRADINTKTAEYSYRKIPTSGIHEQPFYSIVKNAEVPLKEGTAKIGVDLGPGIYVTDNPNVAHGIGANRVQGYPDQVAEIKLDKANLIDLDSKLPDDHFESFKKAVEPLKLDKEIERFRDAKGTDLVDYVKLRLENQGKNAVQIEKAVREINDSLKAQKIDGLIHTQGDGLGEMETKYNSAVLFNEDLPQVTKMTEAKNNYEPSPANLEEIRKSAQTPESSDIYDPKAHEILKETPDFIETPKMTEIKQEVATVIEQAKDLEKIDALLPNEKEGLKQAVELAAKNEIIDQAEVTAFGCAGKGI